MLRSNVVLGLAVLTAALAANPSVFAQTTYTWTASASGNWDVTGNWLGSNAPPVNGSATSILEFQYSGATIGSITATNNLAGTYVTNGIVFRTFTSSTMIVGGTNIIQLGGTNPFITLAGSGVAQILAPLDLAANVIINGTGLQNLTLSGAITGSFGITVGTGGMSAYPAGRNVTFSNASGYAYTGGLTLNGGNITTSTTSTGVFGTGGLKIGSGTSTWTVSSSLASGFTGGIDFGSNNGTLEILGASGITSNAVDFIRGTGNLVIRNTTTALTLQRGNTLTGTVLLDISKLANNSSSPGTLTLNGGTSGTGTDFGALPNVSAYDIRAGGVFAVSNSTVAFNANRVKDDATITLRNGTMTYAGTNTNVAASELVGGLSGSAYNTVTVTPSTTASATLTFDSLSRIDRGTFLFRGTNLGTAGNNSFVNFTTAPSITTGALGTTSAGILPYALVGTATTDTGSSFATFQSGVGIRPLAAGEFTTALTANTNVRLSASVASSSPITINSLQLNTSGAVTGSGTITVSTGAVATIGGTSIAPNLNFDTVEGIWHATAATIYAGNLTGSGGFTKSGTATLTLSGNNTGLTGTLAINHGRISIAAASNLPGTGEIVAGGTATTSIGLTSSSTTAITIGRDIKLLAGWFNPANTTTGALTLSGNISGSGGLYYSSSSSELILTGTNTYTGPTRVFNGSIVISSDANLGNGGALDLFSSSTTGLRLTGDWTTSRPVSVNFASAILTNGFNATLNGPFTGSSALNKIGTGRLEITSAVNYSGALTANANGGEIRLSGAGGVLSSSFTLNTNTALVLDNTTNGFGDRVRNDAAIALASGGTLRMIGNSTTGLNESVGTTTLTGGGNVIEILSDGSQINSLTISNLVATSGLGLVRGTNLGASSGSVGRLFLGQFNSAAVTNGQFLAGITAENLNNPGVIDQAVYDTTLGVRIVSPSDFINGSAIQNAAPTNLGTTANFRVNPAVADPVLIVDTANTINSLRYGFQAGSSGKTDYQGGTASTLTITSGSINVEANANSEMNNTGAGLLTVTAGTANLGILANGNLTINARLGGTGGLTKSGTGTLTITTAPTTTGTYAVNGGILNLNAAPPTTVNYTITAGTLAFNSNTTAANLTMTGGAVTLGANFSTTGNVNASAGTIALGANTLSATSTSVDITSTISGSGGSLALNPTATALLVLRGNNTFTGGIVGNANARLLARHENAFGTGPVNLSAQTASSTFSFPTIGYNFGSVGATGNIPNAIQFTTAAVTVVIAQNDSAVAGQTLRLTGILSGGSASTLFQLDESGSSQANVVSLENSSNTIRGTWRTDYGTLMASSNNALGDAANGINLINVSTTNGAGFRFGGNFTLGASRTITVSNPSAINTNGFNGGIDGVLAGTAALTKSSAGTLTLSNTANTHTGAVTVAAGTLLVNGLMAGAATPPTLTVNSGATLGGSGNIGASGASRNVTMNGGSILATGNSIGTLTVDGNVTINGNASPATTQWNIELNAVAPNTVSTADQANVDRLVLTGAANNLNLVTSATNRITINVSLLAGEFTLGSPVSYRIATANAGTNFQTNGGTFNFDPTHFDFTASGFVFSGNPTLVVDSNHLVLTLNPVPEPATIIGVGLLTVAGAGWVRRRRAGRA